MSHEPRVALQRRLEAVELRRGLQLDDRQAHLQVGDAERRRVRPVSGLTQPEVITAALWIALAVLAGHSLSGSI
jgi:hypothetical protein